MSHLGECVGIDGVFTLRGSYCLYEEARDVIRRERGEGPTHHLGEFVNRELAVRVDVRRGEKGLGRERKGV